MPISEIIAYLAATFTTVAFIPQAILVWRTGDTKAISFTMYTIFIAGLFLWTVYGVMTLQVPIIIANTITIILGLSIWWVKVRNMRVGEK